MSTTKAALGILGMLTLTATGCMTTPHDGENIGTTTSPVWVSGFTDTPGETILIEALNPLNNNWKIISWAVTASSPASYKYDGRNWYGWADNDLVIPSKFWVGSGVNYSCQLRGRRPSSPHGLPTFSEWNLDLLVDYPALEDLWAAHGAGNMVTLFASKKVTYAPWKPYPIVEKN